MTKYKHIGIILTIVALFITVVCNKLQYNYGIFIVDIVYNGFPYYINFILALLMIAVFISFRFYQKKIILFVFSIFILQNLLYSGMVDIYRGSEDYDIFNDFSGLFASLVSTIGIVTWGILFDYLRNKKRNKNLDNTM